MRRTLFYRVSDCVNAAGKTTSVCMTHDRLEQLLRLAYGARGIMNAALRAASRSLYDEFRGEAVTFTASWSSRVVDLAHSKLAGNFQPAKAAALAAERLAAEQLAAENNEAWAEA